MSDWMKEYTAKQDKDNKTIELDFILVELDKWRDNQIESVLQ